MVKRFLITTADERTWKFDRPVLFLNEWCRLYNRRSVWEGMDAIVARPYRLQPELQQKDIICIQELTNQLLIELSNELNLFHNTNHKPRYWNILLGHWLQRYIFLIFDRYHSLEQALQEHEVVGTTAIEPTDYNLATTDSLSAIWACNDDIWNHVLYLRILEFLGGVEIDFKSIESNGAKGFTQLSQATSANFLSIKSLILATVKHILPIFKNDGDAFIINSYLPKWQEFKLQLALGQCPQIWRSPPLGVSPYNSTMRRLLTIGAENHTGFERFLRLQLPEMMPICYLEGYDRLCHLVKTLPWPRSPKFIFTSNNFDTDEIFQAWVGQKVEQGIPYFAGQHGANYGTFMASPDFTVAATCDRFLTWGWTNNNPKNIPAFIFKKAGEKAASVSKEGGLLLIELPSMHRFGLADVNAAYSNFHKYQGEQFQFVEGLPERIQRTLTVRLHGEWSKHRWFEGMRWSDRLPTVRIEDGKVPIQELIAKSRLIVHSYDSTGILETLTMNIPTLCFWYGGLSHLLPSAKPFYELLREAGILFDTPEQAASHVAKIWGDIDSWWKSDAVQRSRNLFCEQYARSEKNPVRALKQIFITETKKLTKSSNNVYRPISLK